MYRDSGGHPVGILRYYNYTCQYCGAPANEVDHIVPKSNLGSNKEENLVACCKDCNVLAGARVFSTFSEKQDYILAKKKQRARLLNDRCLECGETIDPSARYSTRFMCSDCNE